MNEEEISRLLKAIPGARRAANGVLLQTEDGNTFHVQGVLSSAETEGLNGEEHFFVAFCARGEILRLRAIRNAHDYLLRMRAMAIVDSPRTVRVMRKRREVYESTGRPWALTHYYHSLDKFHKAYIDSLPRAHARKLKSVPSGLLPITDANAACVASLTGEVVVVSESLYYFYYFMTVAVFGKNLEIGMADRANAVLIAFRLMNQSEALDFDLDPRGALPPKTEARVQALVFDQMQFTFGHEYAHYLCGHTSTASVSLPGNQATARAFACDLEFEADFQAINLVRQTPSVAERIAQGGMFALIFLDLLYRLKGQHGLRSLPVSETHPAPIERLWALHRTLGSRSPMSAMDIEHSIAVCTQLVDAFSKLLEDSPRADVLTFYGSIYLPSYTEKLKIDRIDF